MSRLSSRLGSTNQDLVLTAVFLLVGALQVMLIPFAAPAVALTYVLGSTLPLAWRRTHPIPSSLLSTLSWLISTDGYPVAGYVVVMLQFFSLGSRGRPRAAVVAVAAWAAIASTVGTLLGPEPTVTVIGAMLAVIAPVAIGQVVARLRHQNAELARLAAELRAERRRAEETAVGAERARIVQELHDVVGHELTLIAIQAEAASTALRLDPSRAAQPVEAIRATAHTTLNQMRAMFDVLTPVGEPETAHTDLDELARRAADAGISNSLQVRGTPAPSQSTTALAVHRIVRECLTNAGRHGAGPVAIGVTWSDREVHIRATNRRGEQGDAGGGRGLAGLRARSELLGGTFGAEIRGEDFVVEAILPCTGDT